MGVVLHIHTKPTQPAPGTIPSQLSAISIPLALLPHSMGSILTPLGHQPSMRLSSVHLMAGNNCLKWSGNRHGSSLWDLLSLDLSQDPGGRNIPACPHITTGELLTSLWHKMGFSVESHSEFLVPGIQSLVWTADSSFLL